MSPQPAESLDWLHFIDRSGEPGRRWADEYRGYRHLSELCQEALLLLRARRKDEGRQVLEGAGREREALRGVDPSIRAVLDRWYYGVLGYYLYTLDAFDDADHVMRQAHATVADAVGMRRFLIPLAYHCHEFYLHRARIARNRMHWGEMRVYVDEVRGMMEGCVPLCTLADGTPVPIGAVQEFYRSLAPLSEVEHAACRRLLDDAELMRGFDRFIHVMYQLPGTVIPYP